MTSCRSIRFSVRRRTARLLPATLALLVSCAGCMLYPRDAQVYPKMGHRAKLTGMAAPSKPVVFEYAVHEKTPSGYTVAGWKPLASCTTGAMLDTDVQGIEWAGCTVHTELPTSDCTFGGTGAWRGNPADSTDGQRFAHIRASSEGTSFFVFPEVTSDQEMYDYYLEHGGFETISQYAVMTGMEATVRVTMPRFGSADLVGDAHVTDLFVAGSRAFVTREFSADAPEFVVMDVADPGAPAVIGWRDFDVSVNAVFVEGDYAYLGDAAGALHVVDVRNPSAPNLIATKPLFYAPEVVSLAAVADMIYVGRKVSPGRELIVLQHDLAQPGTVIQKGGQEIGADVTAIDVTHGIAYLGTNHPTNKVMAINVGDPQNITAPGSSNLAGSFAITGVDYHAGRLYAVSDTESADNFLVFSVTTDPSPEGPPAGALSLISSLPVGAKATGVTTYAGRALISADDPAHALTLLDVRNLPWLTLVGVTPATGAASAIGVHNGIAILATENPAAEIELVSPGVPLEPVIGDANSDGQVTVGCLGDSNTGGGWCEMVGACFTSTTANAPAWCAEPGGTWPAVRPSWRTANHSGGFAAASPIFSAEGCCFLDGSEEITQAFCESLPVCDCVNPEDNVLCTEPCPVADVVLIALGEADTAQAACPGTNILNCGVDWTQAPGDVEPILEALQAIGHTAEVGHNAQAFYPLSPPLADSPIPFDQQDGVCGGAGWEKRWDRAILELNNRIRHELPRERIVDFFWPVVDPNDYKTYPRCGGMCTAPETCPCPDGVHLAGTGQEKRARAALEKLKE